MRNDLINPGLFGNDAGEDEDPVILNNYFLEKGDFQRGFSTSERLVLVRSRKGAGKSALLRQAFFRRQVADVGELMPRWTGWSFVLPARRLPECVCKRAMG